MPSLEAIKIAIRRILSLTWKSPLARIESRIARLEAGWDQHIPAFLDAMSRGAAFDARAERIANGAEGTNEQLANLRLRLEAEVANLRARIDMIAHGYNPSAATIADPKRFASFVARGARLRVCCGGEPDPEWLNVDDAPRRGIDVVAPLSALPFALSSVQEISAPAIFDIIEEDTLWQIVLPHWRALVRSGGSITIGGTDYEAPSVEGGAATFVANETRGAVFPPESGSSKLSGRSVERIADALGRAKLTDVQVIGTPTAPFWNFTIMARIPDAH